MNDALMYFLKVNIAIALFYLFYRLAFYNDTFWATRRFYLMATILLSVIYPFISLSGWLEKQEPMQVIMAGYVNLNEITVTNVPTTYLTFENILLTVYGLVSIILLIRMIVQLTSILMWRLKGKKQILNGIEIIAIDATITPFSFFNTIFINPVLHNEEETRQILTHENTHARQFHSLDVLLSELMTVLFWINPAAWLLKREIRQNLEFLADNSVLKSGIDSKNYQYHLLQLSFQVPENQLINKFNISPLKKRITMMNQQKSKKAGILKYALIVPLALVLILSSNAETLVNKTKDVLSQKEAVSEELSGSAKTEIVSPMIDLITNEVKDAHTAIDSLPQNSKQVIEKSDNDRIYTVVEKMPQFPGGEKELMNFIGTNLRYPVVAQQNGIQGKIIVRFIVTISGKVENAEVVRGIDPTIDKEGLRVVNSLPDWIPGEQNEKKVAVYYTLPINFKLDDSKPDKKEAEKARENFFKNLVVLVDGIQQPIGFDYRSIKQEDIKSINVLKTDTEIKRAELVAKYGENANSGVIVITLKK